MPKIHLPRLGAGMGSVDLLNFWATTVEDALDNTVSRNGGSPNQMEADLDLNDNDLLNVQRIDASEFYRNGIPLEQSVVYGDKRFEIFSGNGVQTVFPLAINPGSVGNLEVSVAGAVKRPGLDFNLTGSSLTFVSPVTSGTNNILVRYDEALPIGVVNTDSLPYTPPSTGLSSSIKLFLDSLWTASSVAGGALVRFLQSGSGAQASTLQDKARERVSVTDFMTSAQKAQIQTGTGNQTAAFQAAAAACAALGVDGHLHIPKGIYNISAEVVIQFSGVVSGAGTKETIIRPLTNTQNVFTTVGSYGQVVFRDFSIEPGVTMVGGAGILLNTAAPADGAQHAARIYNCRFENLARGVEVRNATYWVIDSCAFYNVFLESIFADCTDNFDAGDNTVVNCLIISGATGFGIRLVNNCRVINNKILGGEKGIFIEPNTVPGTRVDYQIIGNSIENQGVYGIHMRVLNAGTGIANSIIGQNQLSVSASAAEGIAIHGPVAGLSINNNLCVLSGANSLGISTVGSGLGFPNTILINDNIITGGPSGSTGIYVGGGATIVDNNLVQAAITPYNIAIAGVTVRNTAFTFATLPANAANGSVVYCADGTIANPVAGGGTGCIAKRLNGVWVGN